MTDAPCRVRWSGVECGEPAEDGLACAPCRRAVESGVPRVPATPPAPREAPGKGPAAPRARAARSGAPGRLTLPFALLVSDNRKAGGMVGVSSREYRAGKRAIRSEAREQWAGRTLTGEVRLRGVYWLPDERRRDTSNFVKALHDALETVCYEDDEQVTDYAYRVAGEDAANPRLELVLEPLTTEESQ